MLTVRNKVRKSGQILIFFFLGTVCIDYANQIKQKKEWIYISFCYESRVQDHMSPSNFLPWKFFRYLTLTNIYLATNRITFSIKSTHCFTLLFFAAPTISPPPQTNLRRPPTNWKSSPTNHKENHGCWFLCNDFVNDFQWFPKQAHRVGILTEFV